MYQIEGVIYLRQGYLYLIPTVRSRILSMSSQMFGWSRFGVWNPKDCVITFTLDCSSEHFDWVLMPLEDISELVHSRLQDILAVYRSYILLDYIGVTYCINDGTQSDLPFPSIERSRKLRIRWRNRQCRKFRSNQP